MPVKVEANLRGVSLFIEGLERELLDLRPLWDRLINRVIIADIVEVFQSDGRSRWPPRVDNLPHPLLRKSRRLYRSLTEQSHSDNISNKGRTSLEYGSSVPYHNIHEEGRGRVPARPVLGLLTEDSNFEQEIEREINDYFQDRINQLERRV